MAILKLILLQKSNGNKKILFNQLFISVYAASLIVVASRGGGGADGLCVYPGRHRNHHEPPGSSNFRSTALFQLQNAFAPFQVIECVLGSIETLTF